MIQLEYSAPGIEAPGHAIFLAIGTDPRNGLGVVPFSRGGEGSTVFLPFRANRLYSAQITPEGVQLRMRRWQKAAWSPQLEVAGDFSVTVEAGVVRFTVRLPDLGNPLQLSVAMWAKNLGENDGWGRLLPNPQLAVRGGFGDQVVPRFHHIDLEAGSVTTESRVRGPRPRIYQLLPRLFGNTNETRKLNGTLAENGCGKFADIDETALRAIAAMSFTHVWLTGVLRQATATDYSAAGLPADDPDLLKGLAGSPYAVKDAFDVCPDYARDPADRREEFRALLERIHAQNLRAIIDFVPNHVARSYESTVAPEHSFGAHDDASKFFDPRNNFFHLHGQPLQLPTWKDGVPVSPTCKVLGTCDGRFDGERDHARVTGNNVASPTPALHDWYETVKLNYGFDFTSNTRAFPHAAAPDLPVPDTWQKMDRVLAHWQSLGVDGFRCDMAHMVPPEFWAWAIGRARARRADVLFIAEAYDNDPMKVPSADPLLAALNDQRGHVMLDLLACGFDAVYDDPTYKKVKAIYDAGAWANDLDGVFGPDFVFENSLRYAENHDEVRLAAPDHWAGIGMNVGRPVAAILYGLSRGPVLLYHGQEVGEPAASAEGFGGDDARTTIFDYWSMPEFAKWVNGHRYDGAQLSPAQRELREFYARLIALVGEPAFRDGAFFPLNSSNIDNDRFGRLDGESASGHWLYAFLRQDATSGQRFLVAANLHRGETLRDVQVRLTPAALDFLGIGSTHQVTLRERLHAGASASDAPQAAGDGLRIGELPPLSAGYFQLLVSAP